MRAYLFASFMSRRLTSIFIRFNGFVKSLLREDVNYDSHAEDGEQKIDDVGRIVLARYGVALLTELVCPVVSVDAAGQEGEDKGYAAAGLIFAGCLVELVGEADKPVDGIYTAGY